jgi:hypothetical protein
VWMVLTPLSPRTRSRVVWCRVRIACHVVTRRKLRTVTAAERVCTA